MTLQRFSFGSAAKVLDDDAGEERDGVEVGFGFGDGYDFAIVGCTCDLEGVANEADSRVAVEDKSLQIIILKSAIGEVNLICVVSSAALPIVMPEMRFSDHLCYWDEGFPALMLTDTALFRNPNYHRHTDTVDTLDFKAMASITENLVSALARFAGISPSS